MWFFGQAIHIYIKENILTFIYVCNDARVDAIRPSALFYVQISFR